MESRELLVLPLAAVKGLHVLPFEALLRGRKASGHVQLMWFSQAVQFDAHDKVIPEESTRAELPCQDAGRSLACFIFVTIRLEGLEERHGRHWRRDFASVDAV